MDEWRARGVATEPFEFLACEARIAGSGMQGEAVGSCAELAVTKLSAAVHGTAAEARHRCAGLGSERDAALY